MIGFLCFYFFIGMLALILYTYLDFIYFIIIIMLIVVATLKVFNKKLALICLAFFSIGFINNYIYYNVDLNNNVYDVRILEKGKEGYIGECRGKKYIVILKDEKYNNGIKLRLRGNCTPLFQYDKGIVGKIHGEKIIDEDKDIIYKTYLFKEAVREKMVGDLGEDGGNLISSVAFGYDDFMDKGILEEFKTLGIVHVISVSGFHIALIYMIMEKLFGIYIGLGISFIYTLFTGAEAATLRSFIMIFLMKISKNVYKKYKPLNALNFSAIAILVFKPYYFLNIGFILSYLATLGIILFNKKLNKLLYKLPGFLRTNLSLTLSAQVFVIPFTVCYFNTLSLGFILGNLVLLPLYTAMVVLGNMVLLFYRVNFIWYLMRFLLNKILYIHNSLEQFLLWISPSTITMGYFYGLCFMALFICFIFYGKGYKKLKWIPLCILMSILIYEYSFFTTIESLNVKWGKAYVIHAGFERYVVTNVNPKYLTYKCYDKISKFNKEINVRISRNYDILFMKDYIALRKDGKIINKIENVKYAKIIGDKFIEIGE